MSGLRTEAPPSVSCSPRMFRPCSAAPIHRYGPPSLGALPRAQFLPDLPEEHGNHRDEEHRGELYESPGW